MSSVIEPTNHDEDLAHAVSRQRLAALIEAGPVLRRAFRVMDAQMTLPEQYAVKTALARLREAAPTTLLEIMHLTPEPALLDSLGHALFAALKVAWVLEAKSIADQPF